MDKRRFLVNILAILVTVGLLATLPVAALAVRPTAYQAMMDPALLPAIEQGDQVVAVIVQSEAGSQAAAAAVRRAGGEVTADLWIIKGVAARVSGAALARLRADPTVSRISRDIGVRVSGTLSDDEDDVNLLNLPALDVEADWLHRHGITGKGITVAVVDTGIARKPHLKLVGQGSVDFVEPNSPKFRDPHGHGTLMAGIIGSNWRDRRQGVRMGLAPDAKLVSVRVLDANGQGAYSTVIQGLQWVVENKGRFNIRVVNLSLHAEVVCPYFFDALDQAAEAVWRNGIVVVTAAGNAGVEATILGKSFGTVSGIAPWETAERVPGGSTTRLPARASIP